MVAFCICDVADVLLEDDLSSKERPVSESVVNNMDVPKEMIVLKAFSFCLVSSNSFVCPWARQYHIFIALNCVARASFSVNAIPLFTRFFHRVSHSIPLTTKTPHWQGQDGGEAAFQGRQIYITHCENDPKAHENRGMRRIFSFKQNVWFPCRLGVTTSPKASASL